MSDKQFYLLLDELLEVDPGTISGNEKLADLPKWDSLAIMGFIALLDERFGINPHPSEIARCTTVAQLVQLTGGKVAKS